MLFPFLAVAVVLGVIIALGPARRRRLSIDHAPLPKKPWLLVIAVIVQAIWTRWLSHLGPSAEALSWLLPVSYLPVLWFLTLNIRTLWAPVIALGVCLNFTVMLFNGGTMPAPARFSSDPAIVAAAHAERLAPGSKDRVVGSDFPTVLGPLEDQYVITLPGGQQRLVSIGDFVSLGGGIIGLLSVI
ncbi:MAG TPA: DUF5317 family protein [Chloroflexota bacterium]|jgi:hypothetical protein|nr:DUF5317 family protein [Chloroflexota bacterium]